MGRRTRTAAPKARANGTTSAGGTVAWVDPGNHVGRSSPLDRLVGYQQFVLGNVTVIGTLLLVAAGTAATVAVSPDSMSAGDVPLVAIGALATTVLAGAAVLVALLSRRVAVQPGDAATMVRGRRLRVATALFFVAMVLAVATAITAASLALTDDTDPPAADPRNEAALSTTLGGDGAVTVYLKGAVADLADDEYLVVDVTSGGKQIISGSVYPDADGTADLASEARVPAGSTQADAVITVMRGDEVVGSPFTMSTSFSAGG